LKTALVGQKETVKGESCEHENQPTSLQSSKKKIDLVLLSVTVKRRQTITSPLLDAEINTESIF
jgi:hypothetical protein